jgi:UDP-glucose 4-epimerase
MGRSRLVYDVVMKLWPLGKLTYWLGNRPFLRPLMRSQFRVEENEAVIIPVNQAVHGAESVVLPYNLLAPLVERASTRVILNHCLCRQGEHCRTYPHEIGCIFLGDGAAAIDLRLGQAADFEEAMAHVQRAMEVGLTPLVVHAAFDAWVVGIPYRRMLAVCFCCDCCCTIRHGLRLGPPAFWDTVVRLPGLTVEVGDGCTGCGSCVEVCPVRAISLEDGHARIGGQCKGCGRCAAVCPAEAITIRVDESADVLGNLFARIERRTEIW